MWKLHCCRLRWWVSLRVLLRVEGWHWRRCCRGRVHGTRGRGGRFLGHWGLQTWFAGVSVVTPSRAGYTFVV
jgi:hypothetical protein